MLVICPPTKCILDLVFCAVSALSNSIKCLKDVIILVGPSNSLKLQIAHCLMSEKSYLSQNFNYFNFNYTSKDLK